MLQNFYKRLKISPRLYPLMEIARFKMALQTSKVQFAPPTGKICDIQDGHANSEVGYWYKILSSVYLFLIST